MSIQTDATQDCAAEVVPAAPWRVRAVTALPNYQLAVTFNDGSSALLDCSNVQYAKDAGIYQALSSPEIFEQVRLELGVITWPNGADLDPCWIHAETRTTSTWQVPF